MKQQLATDPQRPEVKTDPSVADDKSAKIGPDGKPISPKTNDGPHPPDDENPGN